MTLLRTRKNDLFVLCTSCFNRQIDPKNTNKNKLILQLIRSDSQICYICKNQINNLENVCDKLIQYLKREKYEFNSFLINVTLPLIFYENEDNIRSRYKIRGCENIKSDIVSKIRNIVSKKLDKTIDYFDPDITIHIEFNDQDNNYYVDPVFTIKSKPLFILGRYLKKKGITHQKDLKCKHVLGKMCDSCKMEKEAKNYISIEQIAREHLQIFDGEQIVFSWFGSEDPESLVSGNGRPFAVKIINPKLRTFIDNNLTQICTDNIEIFFEIVKKIPNTLRSFTVITKIFVKCSSKIVSEKLNLLLQLKDTDVVYHDGSKTSKKKIYSVYLEIIDDYTFAITLKSDGGLFIKQFLGRSEKQIIFPTISDILDMKCECMKFDIIDVIT